MKSENPVPVQTVRPGSGSPAALDLVVPFTTPELTLAALGEASRLAHGLDSRIRIIRVQVVPWPLDLKHSPVSIEFLRSQMEQLFPGISIDAHVRLAREFETGLTTGLQKDSVVILASPRSYWPSKTARLARKLRREGYTVILISAEKHGLESKQKRHA